MIERGSTACFDSLLTTRQMDRFFGSDSAERLPLGSALGLLVSVSRLQADPISEGTSSLAEPDGWSFRTTHGNARYR
jgi:hypothetical protein